MSNEKRHAVTRAVMLRFYLSMARCLWESAIRWPFNPPGARLFWLLFLLGWRARRGFRVA